MARKLLRIFEPLEGVRLFLEAHRVTFIRRRSDPQSPLAQLCAIFKRWTYWKQKQTVQKNRIIAQAAEARDVRIAVISPFVDRQHGTERAVAELVDVLAADHKDEIELYAQRVCDINLKNESAAGTNSIRQINWHRVGSLAGPHLIQFLGWVFLNRFTRWRRERGTRKKPDVVFSPGINAIDADVILVHAVFHRVAELQKSRESGGLRHVHRKLYYALVCSLERRIYANPRVTLAAVSRHTADQLARYFGRNDVSVIPNGVNGDHFSPASIATVREHSRQEWNCSSQDFVLLLIGNDWRNKGLKTLLQACSTCKDLPIRLLVVGQDEQAPFRADSRRQNLLRRRRPLSRSFSRGLFQFAGTRGNVMRTARCRQFTRGSERVARECRRFRNSERSGKCAGAERGDPHARVKFFGSRRHRRKCSANGKEIVLGRSRERIAKADGEGRAGKVGLHLTGQVRLN